MAKSLSRISKIALYDAKIISDRLRQIPAEEQEATENEDYQKAAELKGERMTLERELEEKNRLAADAVITHDDVAAVIESWTKIPVHKLTLDETEKLKNLEELIHRRVIGQDEAVSAVSRAIRRGRADISRRKRPVSFIFAGSTGVGKTELVKTIAEVMFDNEEALIRLDMSEYMEKHTVSRLIGSPPGYVGFEEGGQLTEKIRRAPYSVVLFDEIEKAHPDVFNILLQILEDGRLTDSQGRTVNFKNTVIIMTSNLGARHLTEKKQSLGFTEAASDNDVNVKEKVLGELKSAFRPEFLNRVDDIIVFSKLTKDEICEIAEKMLDQLKKRLSELEITVEFDRSAIDIPKAPCDVTFRFAVSADWPSLLAAVESMQASWKSIYERCTAPVFVAVQNDRIVGFEILEPTGGYFAKPGQMIASIGCVGVVPEARNQGIGLQMVAYGADWLKEQECTFIELRYTWLEDWYGKLGFTTSHRQWMGEKRRNPHA